MHLSAAIEWVKNLDMYDYGTMALYTYHWDEILNRTRKLTDERLQDISDDFNDILDELKLGFADPDPKTMFGDPNMWFIECPLAPLRDGRVLYGQALRGLLFMQTNENTAYTPDIVLKCGSMLDENLRLLAKTKLADGAPQTFTTFRTIVLPASEQTIIDDATASFMSSSLSFYSSVHQFGLSLCRMRMETEPENGPYKIVVFRIDIQAGTPVLPLFLCGMQASTEQEVLIMPNIPVHLRDEQTGISFEEVKQKSGESAATEEMTPATQDAYDELLRLNGGEKIPFDFFHLSI